MINKNHNVSTNFNDKHIDDSDDTAMYVYESDDNIKFLDENGYVKFDNILSLDECEYYINYIDELFDKYPDLDGLDIENYNRLRIKNIDLSNKINLILEPLLNNKKQNKSVYVLSNWFPTKYVMDGGLGIHIDENAYEDNVTSTHSIIIYLNHNFSGGRTVFVNDYDTEPNNKNNIFIQPVTGSLLIIDQKKLHFAEKVATGCKYILRGDIEIK